MKDQIYRNGIEQCVGCYKHLKPGDIIVDLGWGKVHTTCFVGIHLKGEVKDGVD